MGNYKRKAAWFAFYDRERIERELEQMAERGWTIDRLDGFFWRYRKAEPEKVHVSVVYVADASAYDSCLTPGQELLRDLCEEDGWTLEATWGQMQVYYNRRENPSPIETDPVTQVESVRRAMKKNSIPVSIGNILIGLMWMAIELWTFHRDPVETLARMFHLCLFLDGILMIMIGLVELVCNHRWYRKAVEAAEQHGVYLEVSNHRAVTWVLNLISYAILAVMLLSFGGRWGWMLLCMLPLLLVAGVVRTVLDLCKRRGFSKRVNLGICISVAVVLTIVTLFTTSAIGIHFHLMDESKPVDTCQRYGRERDVYDDELPLELEDLMDTGNMAYSKEKQGASSPMATWCDYWQWPLPEGARPDLHYVVSDIKWSAMYEFCLESILSKRQDVIRDGELLMEDHYVEVDPVPWKADRVYQGLYEGELLDDYVLCYGNRIVELDLWEYPTTEQMAVIAERLGA